MNEEARKQEKNERENEPQKRKSRQAIWKGERAMRNRLRLCFSAMNLGLVEAVDRSRGVESLDAWMRERCR